VEHQETRPGTLQGQGCLLVIVGMLLACILLVIAPTGYAFYRYRAAQVFSGEAPASGQATTLPTQRPDSYTLTLQPQTSLPGGVTLGFTLKDGFGRTLAASTDVYTTGCPPSSPANQTCPAESRDFLFHNTLGGPVQLTLTSTQPGIEVTVQVRDEDQGGIFASGSFVLFGAFFGCGALLWIVAIAALIIFVRRREQRNARQAAQKATAPRPLPEQSQTEQPQQEGSDPAAPES
jgi:hypothetical protein